jgi:hypothetical protein
LSANDYQSPIRGGVSLPWPHHRIVAFGRHALGKTGNVGVNSTGLDKRLGLWPGNSRTVTVAGALFS